MFRTKYDLLLERVDRLESRLSDVERAVFIYVDKYPNHPFGYMHQFRVGVATIARMLAERAGVEIKYVPGTPESAALEKKKP